MISSLRQVVRFPWQRTAGILILAILLGRPSSGVQAAANVVVGDGSPASCTEAALRDAVSKLNADGGSLSFNCGGADHTIALNNQLAIDKRGITFTIDGGARITLDGQNKTRVLFFGHDQTVTVKDIRIVNGRAASDSGGSRSANQGAGIYGGWNAVMTIEGVTFENNNATGSAEAWHGGGALRVEDSSNVTVIDSVFRNNRANAGGAINNLISILKIENSQFYDNTATDTRGAGGGAIYNDMGKMTIKDSVFQGNSAPKLGGAIYTYAKTNNAFSGPVKIIRSWIDDNRVTDPEGNGGGIFHAEFNKLVIKDTTVSNNVAGRNGAGLFGSQNSTFKIINSTFSGNRLPVKGVGAGITIANGKTVMRHTTVADNFIGSDNGSDGAGIKQWGGTFRIINSIIADNEGGYNNCGGDFIDGGGNVQYPGSSCGSSIRTADPKLGPLQDNGGPAPTHPLLSGSKAINRADMDRCRPTDQRGTARPQGDGCDSGAYELTGSVPGPLNITSPTDGATVTGPVSSASWTASAGALEYKVVVVKVRNGKKNKRVFSERDSAASFDCGGGGTCSMALTGANKGNFKIKVLAYNDLGKRKAKARVRVQQAAALIAAPGFRD